MISLAKLGFKKGMIFESIVTTSNNSTPNAAPMGVTTEDMKHLIIQPYKSTQTYENIILTKYAVINFVDNPWLFYRTALKDNIEKEIQSSLIFYKSKISVPRLKEADAYIESTMIKRDDEEQNRAKFIFKVDAIKVINPFFKPYCRGFSVVIESMIYATRIKYFQSRGMEYKANKLVKIVKNYNKIVEKVAPNSEYTRIMGEIVTSIEKIRKK